MNLDHSSSCKRFYFDEQKCDEENKPKRKWKKDYCPIWSFSFQFFFRFALVQSYFITFFSTLAYVCVDVFWCMMCMFVIYSHTFPWFAAVTWLFDNQLVEDTICNYIIYVCVLIWKNMKKKRQHSQFLLSFLPFIMDGMKVNGKLYIFTKSEEARNKIIIYTHARTHAHP